MSVRHDHFSTLDAVSERLLKRVPNLKPSGINQWRGCCPAHGSGRNNALSVRFEGSRVLLHCFAGCEPQAVLRALGFDGWADFYGGAERPYNPPVQAERPRSSDQTQLARLKRLWRESRAL